MGRLNADILSADMDVSSTNKEEEEVYEGKLIALLMFNNKYIGNVRVINSEDNGETWNVKWPNGCICTNVPKDDLIGQVSFITCENVKKYTE